MQNRIKVEALYNIKHLLYDSYKIYVEGNIRFNQMNMSFQKIVGLWIGDGSREWTLSFERKNDFLLFFAY